MSSKASLESRINLLSGLSSIEKPPCEAGESTAHYRWRCLRYCLKTITQKVKTVEASEIFISHGIEHQRRILCHRESSIFDVGFNKNEKELLILNNSAVQIRHYDGRSKRTIPLDVQFRYLIYMHKIGLFLGWTNDNDQLLLMTAQLKPISTSNASRPIQAAIYNEHTDEIITVGLGYFTSWVVRYGGRFILPRKTTEDDMLAKYHFNMLAIEPTASRTQRAFAASEHLVAVFSVQDGTLLKCAKDLHVRAITTILFFNPLKYLITGSKDGSIKIWNEEFHLQLVFVGHNNAITSLALHPHGPLFISASSDCTLRVWSLETCDEIDRVQTNGVVTSICSQLMNDTICSLSGSSATDLWRLQHIYQLHTSMGFRVLALKSTDNPLRPIRTLALCSDTGLRIISPITGDIITTFLGNSSKSLADATYSINEELTFSLYKDGSIVKADMKTNPGTKLALWKVKPEQALGTCITIYEHMALRGKKNNLTSVAPPDELPQKRKKGVPAANKTLLFVGRCDGSISNIDMETGHVDYEIQGHSASAVTNFTCNYSLNQLISAGLDNTIRLWRVFAHARECLTPMYTFYCSYLPASIASIKNNLAIAYLEHSSATYLISSYDVDSKDRFDHRPDDDHLDEVCCLAACPYLKIFASCSKDATLRIWTEKCQLLRIIRLKAVATSLTFCSQKGDILISIGSSVHKIDFKKYLPKSYRTKLLTRKMREDVIEKPIPFNEQLLSDLSDEENRRLKISRSSFKFTHYVDVLTGDELKEKEELQKLKDTAFGMIDARENEIIRIRDGDHDTKPKQSAKSMNSIKKSAFDKYLKLFYDRPSVTMPMEDDDILETAKETIRLQEEGEPREPEWKPCPIPPVFFNLPPFVDDVRSQLPIRTDGQLPNSAFLLPLKPVKSLTSDSLSMTNTRYRPPDLSAEQMEFFRQYLPSRRSQRQKTNSFIQSSSEIISAENSNVTTETTDGLHLPHQHKIKTNAIDEDDMGERYLDYSDESIKEQKEERTNSAARLHEILNKANQKRIESDASLSEESTTVIPISVLTDVVSKSETAEKEQITAPLKDMKILTKTDSNFKSSEKKELFKTNESVIERKASEPREVSKSLDTTFEQASVDSAAAGRKVKFVSSFMPESQLSNSSAERPPTPLPFFITQFRNEDWFEKYFPNCNERTLPKPWDVASFVLMLVRVLKISEWPEKIDVMRALRLLHQQETIPDLSVITQAVYGIFNLNLNPPRCTDALGKLFLIDAIKLIQALGVINRDYVMELMLQYLQGDREIRTLTMECFAASGLEDRHKYLPTELDSWDVWSSDDADEIKQTLLKSCSQFLDKWSTMLKNQLNEAMNKTGQIPKSARSRSAKTSNASPSRKAPPSARRSDSHLTRAQLFADKILNEVRESDKPVIIESLVDKGAYINVLTFFCESQADKQFQGGATQTIDHKNTIVALPHIPTRFHLVRLGETHRSICRPHRETVFSTDVLPPITTKNGLPAPGQLYGFPPFLNLPLKPIYIDPFGKELEEAASHDKDFLLMLRTAQKYFIQSRSYVYEPVQ